MVTRSCWYQAAEADKQRQAELQLQASQLKEQAQQAAIRERRHRIKEVDNVRPTELKMHSANQVLRMLQCTLWTPCCADCSTDNN